MTGAVFPAKESLRKKTAGFYLFFNNFTLENAKAIQELLNSLLRS